MKINSQIEFDFVSFYSSLATATGTTATATTVSAVPANSRPSTTTMVLATAWVATTTTTSLVAPTAYSQLVSKIHYIIHYSILHE